MLSSLASSVTGSTECHTCDGGESGDGDSPELDIFARLEMLHVAQKLHPIRPEALADLVVPGGLPGRKWT